jgi:hypothetical protein
MWQVANLLASSAAKRMRISQRGMPCSVASEDETGLHCAEGTVFTDVPDFVFWSRGRAPSGSGW